MYIVRRYVNGVRLIHERRRKHVTTILSNESENMTWAPHAVVVRTLITRPSAVSERLTATTGIRQQLHKGKRQWEQDNELDVKGEEKTRYPSSATLG